MKYGLLILVLAGCSQIVKFEKECDVDSDCSSFLMCQDTLCVEPAPPPPACRVLHGLSEETDFHNKSALRIGLMMPRNGELEAEGDVMERVVGTLAFELNQAGGVSGRKLVFISCDSSGTKDEVARRAMWLVGQAKVPVLIGPLDDAAAEKVFREVTKPMRALHMAPQLRWTASDFESDDGLFWKLRSPEVSQLVAMAKVLDAKGYSKVAILRPDDHEGIRLSKSFKTLYCGQSDCLDKPILEMVYEAERENRRAVFSVADIDVAIGDFEPSVLLFFGDAEAFVTLADQDEALASLSGRPIFGTHRLHDVMSLQMLNESRVQALADQLVGFRPSCLKEEAYREFSDWFTRRFPTSLSHLNAAAAFDSAFLAAYLYAAVEPQDTVDGVSLSQQLLRLTQGGESTQIRLASFGETRDGLQSDSTHTVDLLGASGSLDFGDTYTTQSAVDAWYYDAASGQIKPFGEILSDNWDYQDDVLSELGSR